MERKGTASNIELKRWVTESKMFTNNYPVFAILEDENRNIVKRFKIIGCTTDGEQMWLRLKERETQKK